MIDLFKIYSNQIKTNKTKGASLRQWKHFFDWKKSLSPDSSSITDKQPWITYDVIDFLKKVLTKDSRVFEYGGGGSTLFFVARTKEVVTVEHNAEWFENVKNILEKNKINNWTGHLLLPEYGKIVHSPVLSSPDDYTSEAEDFKEYNFKKYAGKIDEYPDGYFDVVLVDGRSRPACIKHSVPKIKKGGYLVVDNSDREYYLSALQKTLNTGFSLIIDNLGASPYSRIFTKTSVWQKK